MAKSKIAIREIQPQDNQAIEAVIRGCFHEFKIPLEGTAYADPETKKMYESYQKDKEVYFVVTEDDVVLGGAGIKPLSDSNTNTCELQKMYFSPKIRGKGLGHMLFKTCLEAAKNMGFTTCYIESASQLKAAIHLYESHGFKHLDKPLGNTGHFSCGIWMTKAL